MKEAEDFCSRQFKCWNARAVHYRAKAMENAFIAIISDIFLILLVCEHLQLEWVFAFFAFGSMVGIAVAIVRLADYRMCLWMASDIKRFASQLREMEGGASE